MDKIDIVERIMTNFWKITEKNDAKRIASQTPDTGLTLCLDIPYIDDGKKEHLLDVYYPENAENLPVIIDIHGGGWMYGYKEINKYYCMHIAKKGFVVFNINYSLVPDVTFAGQVRDCMAAFHWIGEHLGDYPCDKSSVFLTGDSAGGHLASYLAVVNTSEKLREMYDTLSSSLEFNALCLTSPVAFPDDGGIFSFGLSPIFGKDRKYRPYGKLFNTDSVLKMGKTPPVLIITSTGDFLAEKQSHKLRDVYELENIPVILHDFPAFEGKKLEHVFAVINPFFEPGVQAINEMIEFFNSYR